MRRGAYDKRKTYPVLVREAIAAVGGMRAGRAVRVEKVVNAFQELRGVRGRRERMEQHGIEGQRAQVFEAAVIEGDGGGGIRASERRVLATLHV